MDTERLGEAPRHVVDQGVATLSFFGFGVAVIFVLGAVLLIVIRVRGTFCVGLQCFAVSRGNRAVKPGIFLQRPGSAIAGSRFGGAQHFLQCQPANVSQT